MIKSTPLYFLTFFSLAIAIVMFPTQTIILLACLFVFSYFYIKKIDKDIKKSLEKNEALREWAKKQGGYEKYLT